MQTTDFPSRVKKWEVFEVQIEGTSEGNPFTEQRMNAVFSNKYESVVVEGFYDGSGIYKVRFMPEREGKHTFAIRSTFMNGSVSGTFYVDPAEETNKGPVHVANTYHFAYANGDVYNSVGTTAYVWDLQSEEKMEETIESLKKARFNKIRFCIFPKHYVYNFHEPASYPYEGTPMDSSVLTEENFLEYWGKDNGSEFDHTRFNPAHFARVEKCIEELGKAGIEADLILFHPYDRWGFSCMSREENDLYLRYVINRMSAYHNVWWAMANEWDLIPSKSKEDWEHYGTLVQKLDRYQHPRSIHNCREMYDHNEAWITHASVQRVDLYKGAELTDEFRTMYGKPVVMDEIAYEGNLPHGWGNITAEEMIRRFWETAVRGGYPGHGETYLSDDGVIWWSHGGKLHGESWKRVGFLLDIMNEVPGSGLSCIPMEWDSVTGVPEEEKDEEVKSQYLFYYTFMRPSSRTFHIDDETCFAVDIIDTWNMTITDGGVHRGTFTVALPAQQYMAIRLRRTEEVPAEETMEEKLEAIREILNFEDTAEPSEADAPTEVLPVVEEPEEITEAVMEEEEETASADEDTELFSIPEMMNTLREMTEYAETPSEQAEEDADSDVDLTLKLEEIIVDDAPAQEPMEEAEEEPAEEETAEEEDDDIFDLIETEQDIENTIQMLKLQASRTLELDLPETVEEEETELPAEETMDEEPAEEVETDVPEIPEEAEEEPAVEEEPVVEEESEPVEEEPQMPVPAVSDDTDVTGKLREALDSILLTGETSFELDDVLDTPENANEEDDELPDLITGRFPIISELTHRLFRSKK